MQLYLSLQSEGKGNLTDIEQETVKMKLREFWRFWPWRLVCCGYKTWNASSHEKLKEANYSFLHRGGMLSQHLVFRHSVQWNFGLQSCEIINTSTFLVIHQRELACSHCTPLQYSCLANPMDGGAWWAAVSGVAQSRTQLKWPSSSSMQPT